MKTAITLFLAVACLFTVAAGAAPATQPVADAIAHLGDPDPAVREQALRTLRAAGDVRGELQAAANGDDPEIAARARDLLRTADTEPAGDHPDPDDLLPGIKEYFQTAPTERRQKINELATSPAGIRALTRLWHKEADPDLRSAIFDQLISELSESTAAFLADGNVATAEFLLQAAVDRKEEGSPRAYAAYWLCRGKLDEAIRRWSSRGGQQPPDEWAEQMLAALYRASGDSQLALVHARAAGNSQLLRQTLLWAGDWPALAADLGNDAAAAKEPRDLALLCGALAMAGDERGLDVEAVRLAALAQGQEQAGIAADILLAVNRPDAAVKVLLDAHQYYAAYEIFADRGKFADADDLLAVHDADMTEDALLLRGSAAKELARLGEKTKCTEMIQRLIGENAEAKSARVYVSLAEAERDIGLTDKAWDHFETAIASAGDSGAQWYVARAFPPKENDVDWPGIWMAAFSDNPQRPVKEVFDKVRRAYDGSMPIDELTKAVSSANLSNKMFHPYIELIWDLAHRIRAAGSEADAIKFVETQAVRAHDGDLYTHLGDWAAEKRDWRQAADRYETAYRKDRLQPLPLYLSGWALENAGQAAEGRRRIALAQLLCVGDEARSAEMVDALVQRGLDVAATRAADVLIRTGDPLTASSQQALRAAAALGDDRGDFALSAALWQRVETDYLAGSFWFESHSQYLHLPNVARDSRARALIAAGDWNAAQREVKASMELLPIDSTIVIDVVPELDRAGRHAEADALFDKMFAVQEALCEKHPDSVFQLNECAWLEARCHRRLEQAIVHARRAVELDPKHGVDAIDTLAEAYFQHGDFKLAVIEEKKCVEQAPDVPFHRRQLARFETAAKGNTGR